MRSQAFRICLIALCVFPGCKSHDSTILVVRVSLASSVIGKTPGALRTTVKAESGRESSVEFRNPDGSYLRFPTSFSLELPRTIMGPVRLEVIAQDAAGGVVARSVDDRLEIRVGQKNDVHVILGCEPGGCGSDGGRPDGPTGPGFGDGGLPDVAAGRCGNGIFDDGELCDPGIPAGRRGACPPANCDDGLSCTRDVAVGSGCQLACQYEEVTSAQAGDGCCPAQATAASDPDCSTTCGSGSLEPGETCDPTLPPEHANACPTVESCDDQDSCTRDDLVSAGTCSAVCARRPILAAAPGDGCCPLGASSSTDPDCPVVCGNGRYEEAGGETCDPALPATDRRRCSEACPDDADPCTTEMLVGAGCQTECRHIPIERSIAGDGCCLPGVGRAFDTDCPAVCGNGLVEPGEFCDKAIAAGTPGACPSTCSEPGAGSCVTIRLDGSAEACNARCTRDVTLLCQQVSDGCCPQGCATGIDPDCSTTCGNRVVDRPLETCDINIPSGMIGACPGPMSCTDGNPCTTDQLLSAGTCSARCVFLPVSIFGSDGCCPPGGNNVVDMDCPGVCGNRIVEDPLPAGERCDNGLPADSPGGCLFGCPAPISACVRGDPRGSVANCNARCLFDTISTCQNGDGCCPPGCTRAADDDCPAVCGNGALETGETCDWGIPAGNAGACSYLCDDDDACTFDSTLGRTSDCTRSCRHTPIRACLSGDRCCPAGCSQEIDGDCKPRECGNRVIEAGETCDPPSSCPAACVDDGDPCTLASLLGDAKGCSAACVHMPITVCSGATADRCCPRGCLPGTDQDCGAPTPIPTPY